MTALACSLFAFALLGSGEPPVLTEEAKLLGTVDYNRFGTSVAVDGDVLVVGAHVPSSHGSSDQGQAHVFHRTGSAWTRVTTLDAGVREFGASVAVHGDTIAVGGPSAVHVYERSGTAWTQTQTLSPSPRLGGIDIDGPRMVVGILHATNSHGAAWVYARSGSTWSFEGDLAPSSPDRGFGKAVALDGDRALVGAHDAGAVYVFERSGSVWTETARLQGAQGDLLGTSVALSGDTLLAGAPWWGDAPQGGAYVFRLGGTSWDLEGILSSSAGYVFDQLGTSVALAGENVAIVGDPFGPDGLGTGAAHVFERSGTTWTETARMLASDGVPSVEDFSWFGVAVATDGTTVAVGAPQALAEGAAYVGPLSSVLSAQATFCYGTDGALTACPCGYAGGTDGGCGTASSPGAKLSLVAQHRRPSRTATLRVSGLPQGPQRPVVLVRSSARSGSASPFGGGVHCLGMPLARMTTAGGAATTELTVGHAAGRAGSFHYQAWYRTDATSACDPTRPFNVSSGQTLVW